MTPVVAIRPEPGGSDTARAGAAIGLEIENVPLFEARSIAWELPGGAFDGLLVGSANVFRHSGSNLARLQTIPVHCVGGATAAAASAAGFTVATQGSGGLQDVIDKLAPQRLLRLAGKERVELALPDGMIMETCVVYEVAPLPIPMPLAARLAESNAIVLLHSAKAAEHFASECSRLRLDRARMTLAALGPRIAQAAGGGWAAVHSAPQPSDAALLEMVRDMCH